VCYLKPETKLKKNRKSPQLQSAGLKRNLPLRSSFSPPAPPGKPRLGAVAFHKGKIKLIFKCLRWISDTVTLFVTCQRYYCNYGSNNATSTSTSTLNLLLPLGGVQRGEMQ
jgi:hypothetical protein